MFLKYPLISSSPPIAHIVEGKSNDNYYYTTSSHNSYSQRYVAFHQPLNISIRYIFLFLLKVISQKVQINLSLFTPLIWLIQLTSITSNLEITS